MSGTVAPPPALTLVVPTPIPDNAEVPARVELSAPAVSPVTIFLDAFAPSVTTQILTVPQTVVVPARQSSVSFIMRTLPVGGDVNVTIYATATGYLPSTANTVVSSAAPRAASLGVQGYQQTFQSFTNYFTVPFGWRTTYDVPFTNASFQVAYL